MATIVAAAGGGNWTTGATWVGGVAPTAADTASLTSTSGNVTIDAGAVCRSLLTATFAGTLTHTAGVTLTVGDGTAGLGNVALALDTGMTYAPSADTCAIDFVSTVITQQIVDFGGKSIGNVTFSGVGGNWAISSNTIHRAATTVLTLTGGTLHLDGTTESDGYTHTLGSINTGDVQTTRVILFGTATVNLSSTGNAIISQDIRGLTFTPGTSIINITAAGGQINAGGSNAGSNAYNYNVVNFTGSGTQSIVYNSSITGKSFATLNRTGTASKTCAFFMDSAITVTGALILAGESVVNRLLVRSGTLATPITITNSGATMTWSNVDFRGITLGTAFDASAITGLSGDCGGNSNITFTTPVEQGWAGVSGGNWSENAWTSRVPLPQDDLHFFAFNGGQTVTADMPRLGKSITWASVIGSPTFVMSLTGGHTIYGSLTLDSGMTFTTTVTTIFEGRSTFSLSSAGKSFGANITIQMVGGTLTMQDAMSTSGTLTLTHGTFENGGFSTTVAALSSSVSTTRVLTISGTLTLTTTSTVWNTSTSTFLTLNMSGSTIAITDTSASSKTFAGGGRVFNNLAITGGGAGAVIITGANTFNQITVVGGTKSITLPGSTTTTLLSGGSLGNSTNVVTFTASAGSATVSKSSGVLSWNYVNLTNIPSSGGATFYAGANSTDGGGNTGWIFSSAPSGGGGSEMGSMTGYWQDF